MQETKYNIGLRETVNDKPSSDISFVVIPSDIDREVYIKECYDTSSVSIYSEKNGFYERVPVDKYTINFVRFPSVSKEFGSPVSIKFDPVNKMPIIDAIYFGTDELSELEENQFRFKRKLNSDFIEVVGSSSKKYLGLNVVADKEGEIFINIKSKDLSGKLNIHVDGNASIISDGEIEIKQFKKYTCVTVDKEDNDNFSLHEQTCDEETFFNKKTNIITEKVNINDGEEPFILGKKFSKFMKDFITEIGSSTVSTAIGQMPLLNAEKILEYQNKVDELLSEIGFIDK